jgi:ppGpp synthetase/RelA/SpoT-type nucleotidyltranferase
VASKSQVDRLGQRLGSSRTSEQDLRLLDEYRRFFVGAYEEVINSIRVDLGLTPTGRPAKSTGAIRDKLQRESVRLSQIQDIAGCRLVVSDIFTQNQVVEQLISLFPGSSVIDRRRKPSFGYRAVHIVVKKDDKPIEIQVRTDIQHRWAELSEKFSDVVDPSIKYGGGNEDILKLLDELSALIAETETLELDLMSVFSSEETHLEQQERMREHKGRLVGLLERAIANLDRGR